jgi:hypothetical protein
LARLLALSSIPRGLNDQARALGAKAASSPRDKPALIEVTMLHRNIHDTSLGPPKSTVSSSLLLINSLYTHRFMPHRNMTEYNPRQSVMVHRNP